GAARARSVLEYLGGVIAGQLGPARRFAERPPARPNGDPRIMIDDNIFHADDQGIAALRALQPHRPANGIGQRWAAIKAGPEGGNRLVLSRLEITRARIIRLDLEALAPLHPQ